ncbi:hypothetical protein [Clostridium sp. BSD9I1]|uniref:hypothetical protein n=1 Tax=Clostridium sp. BSD9I1 TaxID=2003589 RepID=UPI001647AB9A|nr:hypothetical protein [Clostridium sp. BSD9I1]
MIINNNIKHMNNDMRIVKFETLINDVNEALDTKPFMTDFFGATAMLGRRKAKTNTSLAMVFDYDKLNDYGKVIVESSRLCIRSSSDKYQDAWCEKYPDISAFKDNKYKIEAAKTLVKHCQNQQNRKEAYKFVFWTMMVLTVDKTDAEEHLSLICDFARMLKITDDEMEDMLMVIKVLYHEEESGFEFNTETVPNIFSRVLCVYNN